MSQGLTRLLVAVVAIPVFVAAVWFDPLYFYLLVQGMMLIGVDEALELVKAKSFSPQRWTAYVFTLVLGTTMYRGGWDAIVVVVLTFFIVALLVELFRKAGSPTMNVSGTVFATLFVSLSMGCMIILRSYDGVGGVQMVFLVFAGIWACDSLAYYGGRFMGRNKLFERVSPNKTWEGAFSGLIGAVAGVLIVRSLFITFDTPFLLSLAHTVVIGVFAGTLGQLGDLAESLLKRDAGIKDSGRLIPGHGGILDRFDSMMFVAPAAVIYLHVVLPR